jgi:hypothetical protein
MKKQILLLINIGLILVAGCSRRPGPSEEAAARQYYEVAWIDPQIIASDSAYTLIRSARIDSFAVDSSSVIQPPSIRFHVTRPNCGVAISLLDAGGVLIRPLVFRYLPGGYYRLTLNPGFGGADTFVPGWYVIEADVCGEKSQAFVVLE